jgi:hypothetical protein
MATLPGSRLFHEGQLEGRKIRPPVFLGRRPQEAGDQQLQAFYTRLLEAIDSPVFRQGQWSLCECRGWPDNSSFQNLVAWSGVHDDDRRLVVVNLSDSPVQARVQMQFDEARGKTWRLTDVLSGASYDRDGHELFSDFQPKLATRMYVILKIEDDLKDVNIPIGSAGHMTIRGPVAKPLFIIRRIMIRMYSWMNYLFSGG